MSKSKPMKTTKLAKFDDRNSGVLNNIGYLKFPKMMHVHGEIDLRIESNQQLKMSFNL